MTDTAAKAPTRPWLAVLIGLVVLFALDALLALVSPRMPNVDAAGGVRAAGWIVSTAAGAYAAARLSRRRGPGWIVGLFGLLGAVAYLFTRSQAGLDAPLWLAVSALGSPLLGARLGIGAARA